MAEEKEQILTLDDLSASIGATPNGQLSSGTTLESLAQSQSVDFYSEEDSEQLNDDLDRFSARDALEYSNILSAHVNRGLLGIVDLPFMAANAVIDVASSLKEAVGGKPITTRALLPVHEGLSFATDPKKAGPEDKVKAVRPLGIGLEFAAGTFLPVGLLDEAARGKNIFRGTVEVKGGARLPDNMAGQASKGKLPFGTKKPRTTLVESAANPKFTKGELLFGGVSGIGAGVGSYVSDGNPMVELAFGIGSPVGVSLASHSVDTLSSIGRGAYERLSPSAKADSAVTVILDHAVDREQALKNLQSYISSDVSSPKTLGQITGDEGILGFERLMAKRTKGDFNVTLNNSDDMLAKSIHDTMNRITSEGLESTTTNFLSARIEALRKRIRLNLNEARKDAKSALDRAGTNLEAEDASVVLQQGINKALDAAEGENAQLWANVPEVKVSVSGIFDEVDAAFKQAFKSPTAKDEAQAPLLKELKRIKAMDKKGEVDVRELIDLRSVILDKLRNAKQTGSTTRFYKKLAADVQGVLLKRIGEAEGVSNAYDLAAAHTKMIHETYKNVDFDASSDMAEVLGRNVFLSGERGAKTADQLRVMQGQADGIGGDVENVVRSRFAEAAVQDGVVDAKAGEKFLAKHASFLRRYPKVRAELEEAVKTQTASDRVNAFAQKSEGHISKSRAATFIDFEDPIRAVNDLVAGRIKKPAEAARSLVMSVSKDETGKSLEGLKRMTIDALIDSMTNPKGDFLSNYQRNYERLSPALKEIFKDSPDSLKIIDEAIQDIGVLQLRKGARVPHDRLDEQLLLITLGKIAGARVGAKIGTTPLIAASVGGKIAERVLATMPEDATNRLIEEMLLSPEKFNEVAKGLGKARTEEEVLRLVNAWLINAGIQSRVLEETPEDEIPQKLALP